MGRDIGRYTVPFIWWEGTQPNLQQVCYHQANVRMRSHHLRRLDDNKSVTSLLLAASCELHAGLMQVVSSTCSKSANIKLQEV